MTNSAKIASPPSSNFPCTVCCAILPSGTANFLPHPVDHSLCPPALIADPLPFPSTPHPAPSPTALPIRTSRNGTRIVDIDDARTRLWGYAYTASSSGEGGEFEEEGEDGCGADFLVDCKYIVSTD